INVYGVRVFAAPTHGTLTLNADGTFTYVPTSAGAATPDSFTYCANGAIVAATCSSGLTATVTLGAATREAAAGITMGNITYTASATTLSIKSPGVLSVDTDAAGYPLTVATATVVPGPGLTLSVDASGAFNASIASCNPPATVCTSSFTYKAQNSQGTQSNGTATVTINFQAPSGLAVSVLDGKTKAPVTDYRWIIEEDRTFYI